MSVEIPGKLAYSDLAVVPDDGRRHELAEGELTVTPSPGTTHQRVVKRLCRALQDHFETGGIGEVFVAPTDLILTERDVFVPDLMVVDEPTSVTERGIEAPPLLVVEVLSPTTQANDRGVKARRYAALGVRNHALVDPLGETVECLALDGGAYRSRVRARGDGVWNHPDREGFEIPLERIWR